MTLSDMRLARFARTAVKPMEDRRLMYAPAINAEETISLRDQFEEMKNELDETKRKKKPM